ncbi:MAG: DNA-directed RNA polymerase subunit alpha [Phycisphaerales bacterium]|nr:MAG: DNA-directed RNA polymerase subunit alpha [Phycisphaerales bacterium]
MRIRWRGLELPSRVIKDEVVSTDTYGRFIIEPFERGFGTTVGNSLRRILLSSLEGAAVTSVKIAGAPHEFTSLPGVFEDVTDIILNVKSLVVSIEGDEAEQKTMKLLADKAGDVRASAIEAEAGVKIVNTDHLICTLTDDVSLEIEMTVGKGRGYRTAEESEGPEQEIGVIPVDSVFSPVIRVRYRTEDTRVGQRTNYDRLILEVWTRGTLLPEDAVVEAAKILRKHLNPFVQYYEMGEDVVTQAPPRAVAESHVDSEMQAQLNRPISDLDLSVRASNCLESARVVTIKDLARKTEADLLRVRSFGKTSLREVRRKLADIGLGLGMTFPNGADDETNAPDSLSTVVSTAPGVTTETGESGGTAEQEVQPVEVQADDSHREA